MNTKLQASILTIAAASLATVAFVVAPASAKDKEKAGKHSNHATTTSAAAASSLLGSVPEQPRHRNPDNMTPNPESPGRPWAAPSKKFTARRTQSKTSMAAK
jgi:hypothetical protein